jgi:hypothetical protein
VYCTPASLCTVSSSISSSPCFTVNCTPPASLSAAPLASLCTVPASVTS